MRDPDSSQGDLKVSIIGQGENDEGVHGEFGDSKSFEELLGNIILGKNCEKTKFDIKFDSNSEFIVDGEYICLGFSPVENETSKVPTENRNDMTNLTEKVFTDSTEEADGDHYETSKNSYGQGSCFMASTLVKDDDANCTKTSEYTQTVHMAEVNVDGKETAATEVAENSGAKVVMNELKEMDAAHPVVAPTGVVESEIQPTYIIQGKQQPPLAPWPAGTVPADKKSSTPTISTLEEKRPDYMCGRCRVPKVSHVCPHDKFACKEKAKRSLMRKRRPVRKGTGKSRGGYRCKLCGLPKKGHICQKWTENCLPQGEPTSTQALIVAV